MLSKTHKKSVKTKTLLILLLAAMAVAVPEVAGAYTFSPPHDPIGDSSGPFCPSFQGFTRRAVQCIQNTVLDATNSLIIATLPYFYGIVSAVMTLGVAVWAVSLMGGRAWAVRTGTGLAVKIAVVATLIGGTSFNVQYFYEAGLDSLQELLTIVTGYVDFSPAMSAACDAITPPGGPGMVTYPIWDRVDCALDLLIGGVLPGSTVALGLGGFLFACLITNTAGTFIALLGFYVIIQFVFAIIRAVYIFVLALVAYSLMMAVAPMFIPLIFFQSTRGYFEKWLKLTIGFIMQPLFLIVYLGMLLAAFDTVIYTGSNSLYNAITNGGYGSDCSAGGGVCPPIGQWLLDQEAYVERENATASINYDSENATKTCANDTSGTATCPVTGPELELAAKETGPAQKLGEVITKPDEWDQVDRRLVENIYQAMEIEDYFFRINIPMDTFDFGTVGNMLGYPGATWEDSARAYIIAILISLVMAVATTYIFMLLLEKLPFIGSGIMNTIGVLNPASGLGGFGFGGLSPPGGSMVDGLRKRVFG